MMDFSAGWEIFAQVQARRSFFFIEDETTQEFMSAIDCWLNASQKMLVNHAVLDPSSPWTT